MKRVTLKTMHLVNFRGHKDLTVNFADKTTISGDNRLGKSTIFDAFIWVLFGKDQFDRKDFEIIPIIDGKRADRVDPEATIVLDVDNREIVLKRILSQKWVRRRGTTEEVFDGCDTKYYFNDVPLKAGEYKARVDLIIEESLFKLITNPSAFLALHWTKQREFLFQIAGTVSDTEIASSDIKFAKLLELVNGKSLVEFKKEIAAKKKKLNEDLDKISPKVDQTTRLMPEAIDVALVEKELSNVEVQIKGIDEQLSDRAAAIRGQYDAIQAKQSEINALKTKQQEVVNIATRNEQQAIFEAKNQREDIERNVVELKRKVSQAQSNVALTERTIEETKRSISLKNSEIEKLREEWTAENSKEYTAKSGCLTCPVFGHECSDPIAEGKHEEAQEKAKQSFFDAKKAKLNEINTRGGAKTKEFEALKNRLTELENDLSDHRSYVSTFEAELQSENEKLAKCPIVAPKQVIASELPEWQYLEKHVKEFEASIQTVEAHDNSDLSSKKAGLNQRRDELKKQLDEQNSIGRYKAEIARLEAEGKNIAQQIADIEGQEFTIDAFNNVKIEEAGKRVNRMFEVVNFKLYDITNDAAARMKTDISKGIDVKESDYMDETCVATNKSGVLIAVTNTEEKINAGLEIIRTLSKFYNVSAPVFVDNSESVNEFIEMDTQMVNLLVTKEKVLTIK